MKWWVRFTAAVVVLIAALQWWGPRWMATQVAEALAQRNGGHLPKVTITAIPFWMLLQGRFQAVTVDAAPAELSGFELSRVYLSWTGGQVSFPALLERRVVIQQRGQMVVQITVSEQALTRFLQSQAPLQGAQVSVTPNAVQLLASVKLRQLTVPLDLKGTLALSPDRERVLFLPSEIDGMTLPVPTEITVFDLRRVNTWVPMRLTAVTLLPQQIRLSAVSA